MLPLEGAVIDCLIDAYSCAATSTVKTRNTVIILQGPPCPLMSVHAGPRSPPACLCHSLALSEVRMSRIARCVVWFLPGAVPLWPIHPSCCAD